jgi:hypothetical protein
VGFRDGLDTSVQVKFILKLSNTSATVDEFLLAREKRVASGTNLHANILSRGRRFNDVTASALDSSRGVLGVNIFSHFEIP